MYFQHYVFILFFVLFVILFNLMHEHQGPFVAVVDLLVNHLCYAFPLDLFPPFSQVVVPKLVTVEQVDEVRRLAQG